MALLHKKKENDSFPTRRRKERKAETPRSRSLWKTRTRLFGHWDLEEFSPKSSRRNKKEEKMDPSPLPSILAKKEVRSTPASIFGASLRTHIETDRFVWTLKASFSPSVLYFLIARGSSAPFLFHSCCLFRYCFLFFFFTFVAFDLVLLLYFGEKEETGIRRRIGGWQPYGDTKTAQRTRPSSRLDETKQSDSTQQQQQQ